MDTKHTPGPWTLNKHDCVPQVGYDMKDGGPLLPIAPEVHGYSKREAKANARLIAAAPDLLAALQKIANRDTSRPATFSPNVSPQLAAALAWDMDAEIARAAIAKATGAA